MKEHCGLENPQKEYRSHTYNNLRPEVIAMLGRNSTMSKRRFEGKVKAAFRWLELVIEIGWVIALFGDSLKSTWFTEAPNDDWTTIRNALIHRRHWIRETVREILGDHHEWMMNAPICTSHLRLEITSRRSIGVANCGDACDTNGIC